MARVRVKKNRVTGKDRTVEIPIYHSYGIDDVGSCIDYLIEEGHWKSSKGKVSAPEFDYDGPRGALVRMIVEQGMENDLRSTVQETWDEIEQSLTMNRPPRYGGAAGSSFV